MTENMQLGVKALPCICCGKQLDTAGPSDELRTNQPYRGLCFSTRGHYGSTIFDMCSGFLQITVCDACVVDKAKEGFVVHIHERRPEPRSEIVSVRPFDPNNTEFEPME